MAVRIRLTRMGKKKAPFYRIQVADARSPRDGRFIEEIGYYDPNQEPSVIKVDTEERRIGLSIKAVTDNFSDADLKAAEEEYTAALKPGENMVDVSEVLGDIKLD